MNTIGPLQNTNNIRIADFVRIISPSDTYLFSTSYSSILIPEVDEQPFSALGPLVSIGEAQRDIKSTANETTISVVGIDTALLGWVLGQEIKGSQIQMWHGFFNTEGQLLDAGGAGGLYQFFNGYITSFNISEQWYEDAKMYVGTISLSASSNQLILQNRTAGRYTNNNSWQFFAPNDTSMNRVSTISTTNYYFGKDSPANS